MSAESGTGSIEVVINGARTRVREGITVAAALLNAGEPSFRSSVGGELRGPVCGMGVCYECRVTIDDVAHQRACLRVVVSEMRIETTGVNAR